MIDWAALSTNPQADELLNFLSAIMETAGLEKVQLFTDQVYTKRLIIRQLDNGYEVYSLPASEVQAVADATREKETQSEIH